MKTLTHSDLDILLGSNSAKAWCIDGRIDVDKFSELFVSTNFKPELALYAFLLRDQNWIELLKALQTFDVCGYDHQTESTPVAKERESSGVNKTDMEQALQRFVALNTLTQGNSSCAPLPRRCELCL